MNKTQFEAISVKNGVLLQRKWQRKIIKFNTNTQNNRKNRQLRIRKREHTYSSILGQLLHFNATIQRPQAIGVVVEWRKRVLPVCRGSTLAAITVKINYQSKFLPLANGLTDCCCPFVCFGGHSLLLCDCSGTWLLLAPTAWKFCLQIAG